MIAFIEHLSSEILTKIYYIDIQCANTKKGFGDLWLFCQQHFEVDVSRLTVRWIVVTFTPDIYILDIFYIVIFLFI